MTTRTQRTILLFGTILLLAVVCYLPTRYNSPAARARDDGIARTPPMGWNSWNRFKCDVSEWLIQNTADAMVASGMRDAGYQYVVIDDCWQVARDANGTIVADWKRFPSGMAALADYVHARGLKFGLYTDVGSKTCQGRPGSLGHEWQDAATYAAWGVDYVKVDWCYNDGLDAPTQYRLFRDALAATGRPMVLSICTWGKENPWDWGADTGHLWRTTRDITDRWSILLQIIRENVVRAYAAGPGGWNDPDMLEIGNGGMTNTEYRTHFSLWAMMAAPLIAGNDLTRMSSATRDILLNSEVIAIDQDARGTAALIVHDDNNRQVWSRPLSDPSARAVALFNPTEKSAEITVRWADIGLSPGDALVRDLWAHADIGVVADSFTAKVEPHGTVMLKITSQSFAAAIVPDPVAPPAPPADAPVANPNVRYPYLSDLAPAFADNGLGPIELNISNGEGGIGDGRALTLADRSYGKGLGVHAPSDVRYDLGGTCMAFAADIGLDAEVGQNGTAIFQVWADGALIYDSGALHGGMAPVPVHLDIPGVHELRLVVAPVDWVIDYAHADWADARVACSV
jgi:alpha-galactosidase